MSWHQLKACTAQIAGFVHGIRILLFVRVGVYCRFINGTPRLRVCDAGALRAEPLATLYILRGQKTVLHFPLHTYCPPMLVPGRLLALVEQPPRLSV